ncbi:MAG: hypothetical protein OXE94_14080 [Aestuariivita sp.]|nr:hypothetical protein [Aestuariivita sp.]MCY4202298.1 hypothetical protein [Aestuariivita sp.]
MADALLASDLLTSGYFLPPQNDAVSSKLQGLFGAESQLDGVTKKIGLKIIRSFFVFGIAIDSQKATNSGMTGMSTIHRLLLHFRL